MQLRSVGEPQGSISDPVKFALCWFQKIQQTLFHFPFKIFLSLRLGCQILNGQTASLPHCYHKFHHCCNKFSWASVSKCSHRLGVSFNSTLYFPILLMDYCSVNKWYNRNTLSLLGFQLPFWFLLVLEVWRNWIGSEVGGGFNSFSYHCLLKLS